MSQAIVTGGSGFVGSHLIRYLLNEGRYETIINVDYAPRGNLTLAGDKDRLYYIEADVRAIINPAPFKELGCGPDTDIYNLAAICKIPGYPPIDYFRTNIKGAENMCKLADDLKANTIIFTSSISCYGPSEELKTEKNIPQPDNAYGCSKLVAEYIHRGWQEREQGARNLVILRPGIIFGKYEQANFTRLYNSMEKGFFVYPGRKDARKACVYVKDVARACFHFARQSKGFQLFNLVYPEVPKMETLCRTITNHTDAGPVRFTMPGSLLKTAARVINLSGKITGQNVGGIHPDRVEKVMMSTNVSGKKLANSSFDLQYSLEEAIQDWFAECEGTLY